MSSVNRFCCFFFFNDTATTEIYTLSLHDALPIFTSWVTHERSGVAYTRLRKHLEAGRQAYVVCPLVSERDRKSTRLNSSHANISYAVFCLKKKKTKMTPRASTKLKKPIIL